MKPVEIFNVQRGMELLIDESSMPAGFCRDAVNVDISTSGSWSTRRAERLVAKRNGLHSLWSTRPYDCAYMVDDKTLVQVRRNARQGVFGTGVADLNSSAPGDYTEIGDKVVFSSESDLILLNGVSSTVLGVEDPGIVPLLRLADTGELPAGRYSVGYSFLLRSGGIVQESGLSELSHFELEKPGGLRITMPLAPPGCVVRLYMTEPNGTALYFNEELQPGTLFHDIQRATSRQPCPVYGKTRMMPGRYTGYYSGRLYTALGDTLHYSDPFTYGLMDRINNYVRFHGEITFLIPVYSGLFVGTTTAVFYMSGDGPNTFTQREVSSCPPIPNSACAVVGNDLNREFAQQFGSARVACWMTTDGFEFGLPTGVVRRAASGGVNFRMGVCHGAAHHYNDGVSQVVCYTTNVEPHSFGTSVDATDGAAITLYGDPQGMGDALSTDPADVVPTTAWVINTVTGAMSRYAGTLCHSTVRLGSSAVGVGPVGLFDLDGTDSVLAWVSTGRMALGDGETVRLGQVTAQYAADSPLELTVDTYGVNGGTWTYRMDAREAASPRGNRIATGKGLFAQFFKFRLGNGCGGGAFSVNGVTVDLAGSGRRV